MESTVPSAKKQSRLSCFGLVDNTNAKEIETAISTLVAETTSCLEEVWNEIGYSDEEKNRQVQSLLEDIRTLCDCKIAEDEKILQQHSETVAQLTLEIVDLSQALQENIDQKELSLSEKIGISLLDQLAPLEIKAESLRQKAANQKYRLSEFQKIISSSCEVLGCDMEEEYKDIDTDLTEARVKFFQLKMAKLEEQTEQRKAEVGELVAVLQKEMADLRHKPETLLDNQIQGSLERTSYPVLRTIQVSPSSVGISELWVVLLQDRLKELRAEKEKRKRILLEIGAKIHKLWHVLKIPDSEKDEFQKKVSPSTYGLPDIEEGQKELRRLQTLRKERIGSLIEDVRHTITGLWDTMGTSYSVREDFAAMKVSCEGFTEELLEVHEAEALRLQARFETMEPLFKLIEKREECVAARIEFEKMKGDSSHLMSRGKGATAELQKKLQLEQAFKKIKVVTESLKSKLREWELEEGPFMYQGRRYLDTIKVQDREYEERISKKTRPEIVVPLPTPTSKQLPGNLLPNVDGIGKKKSAPKTPNQVHSRMSGNPTKKTPTSIGVRSSSEGKLLFKVPLEFAGEGHTTDAISMHPLQNTDHIMVDIINLNDDGMEIPKRDSNNFVSKTTEDLENLVL